MFFLAVTPQLPFQGVEWSSYCCYWEKFKLYQSVFFMRQMPGSKQHQSTILRISGPEVFCKQDVLTNIAKFTGKNLCQSLLARLWHRCFPVIFAKFLRALFLTEHLRGLLLNPGKKLMGKSKEIKRTKKVKILTSSTGF